MILSRLTALPRLTQVCSTNSVRTVPSAVTPRSGSRHRYNTTTPVPGHSNKYCKERSPNQQSLHCNVQCANSRGDPGDSRARLKCKPSLRMPAPATELCSDWRQRHRRDARAQRRASAETRERRDARAQRRQGHPWPWKSRGRRRRPSIHGRQARGRFRSGSSAAIAALPSATIRSMAAN